MKKKITEIEETRWRTVYTKDYLGNRHRGQEEYTAFRNVKTVTEGPRFAHYFVDLICYYIIMITFSFLISFIELYSNYKNSSASLSFQYVSQIFFILSYPLYYFFFEALWQKTPGKFLTKTIVINEYGEKPNIGSIILRSLIRLIPFEAFSCFGNRKKQSLGWHDRWSKTYVVPIEERDILLNILSIEHINEVQNE